MKLRIETSRLLVTFFVLAAFLFGQATALEHAAQYGGQVHTLADHEDGQEGDGDGDTLCDLSFYGHADDLTESFAEPAMCPCAHTQRTFNPIATAFRGGVRIIGPPVRGPPTHSQA